jgi:phosphate transport system protein
MDIHHETQLDKELRELKNKLIHMAAIAEAMIDQTIKELVNRNEQYTPEVSKEEEDLNRLQIEIDEQALTRLATRQPVASDLRAIVAATKINSELERIGDLAINITDNVHTLVQQPPLKPLIDIPRMTELARKMVYDSVQAFMAGDIELARSVILTDDEVDALKDQVLRELLTYMMADPRTTERALALILVARHLERIADHATNIAEDVIYITQGRDVRHPKTPRQKPAP